jgi:chromosome segregation ATPase
MTDKEVASLLVKFETEWNQFRGMWDQLTPSFQHMGAVVKRFDEIAHEMPLLDRQYQELSKDVASLKSDLAEGKKSVDSQLAKYREQMENELVPLKNELETARNQVTEAQAARAEAERSFQERRREQESTLKFLSDNLAETQRKLDDIGRLTGAVRVA